MPAIMTDLVRAAADIVAGVLSYPAAALLYLIQLAVYRLYRFIRWFLVIAGVLFPYTDELNSFVGKQFISCRRNDGDGYPRQLPEIRVSNEVLRIANFIFNLQTTDFSYLSYPETSVEAPFAFSSPYPEGIHPSYFMQDLKMYLSFLLQWQSVNSPNDLQNLVNPIHPQSWGGSSNGWVWECRRLVSILL